MILTTSQSAAIRHVDDVALKQQPTALDAIRSSLTESSVDLKTFLRISAATKTNARVELNFHPDRKIAFGATVGAAR